MNKYVTLFTIILLVACKAETNKDNSKDETAPKKQIVTQDSSAKDFSYLFDAYNCNISITQLAEVLQIPETHIALGENSSTEHCVFRLKGFGKGYENTGTKLRFGASSSTKNNNKKVIVEYLKEKEERNGKMLLGRDIILADAGSCYIMTQFPQGRVLILSENYEQLFLISYGNKASVQGRSKEQHAELTQKVVDLANFLVSN